ncbi:hypothetical protein GC169_06490 [bacterium]|nr:hypothetical protein [bacterium]
MGNIVALSIKRLLLIIAAWAVMTVPLGPRSFAAPATEFACNVFLGVATCGLAIGDAARPLSQSEPFASKDPVSSIAAFSEPTTRTFNLNNTSFTTETGEPTEGGLMTRTSWFRLELAGSGASTRRAMIHTFGSEIDTVIAVYSGPGGSFGGLTRIAGNNDFVAPGVSSQQSLVQVDLQPGMTYWLQVGSIGGAQGNIAITSSVLADQGGLSAFLYKYGANTSFNGREYFCTSGVCPTAGFILYNATAGAMTVTPSTTLPTRFSAPAAFQLAAGAVATAEFTGLALTDSTTRTEIGSFVFEGRTAGALTGRATERAVTRVRGAAPATTIAAAVLPSGRAGSPNEPLTGFMSIINSGAQPAIGCHLRTAQFSAYRMFFQATDPASNLPIGSIDAPIDIPAGATRTFVFSVESFATELGDPTAAVNPFQIECANATSGAIGGLASAFALTSIFTFDPADMISIGVTPSGDGILNVPSAGQAFPVATVNIGASATIRARAIYARPFSDPSDQAFTATICKTNPSTGQCLAPPTAEVAFTAAPNVVHTFTAFVSRPASAPAYSPSERRMIVEFRQDSPVGFISSSSATPVSVGSTSAAVRAQ